MILRRFCVSANQLVDTTCFVGRVGCYNIPFMSYIIILIWTVDFHFNALQSRLNGSLIHFNSFFNASLDMLKCALKFKKRPKNF